MDQPIEVTSRRRRLELFPAIVWLLSGSLLAFLLLPLLRLVTTSSVGSLKRALADSDIQRALLLSVQDAAITAVLATLLGVPLAYLLARRNFPGRALVQAVVDLPLAVPHTVAGIALLLVFGRTGWLGAPAEAAGVTFYGNQTGIVVAMLFVSAPFAVNSARVAFEALDPNIQRAARSLGATSGQTFRRISLPLAWRGVLTGTALVYARSISEFGAVAILAYYPATAPVAIYNRFLESGLTEAASAATLLLLVALATFLVLRALSSGWLVGETRPK